MSKIKTLKTFKIVRFFIVGVSLLSGFCFNAGASYQSKDVLETLGIATGFGAVMGLSSTAFYETPTDHLNNIVLGAGAGLLLGLGVAGYLLATAPEENGINPDELLLPPEKRTPTQQLQQDDKVKKAKQQSYRFTGSSKLFALIPVTSTHVAQYRARSLVSEWRLALNVLELRF